MCAAARRFARVRRSGEFERAIRTIEAAEFEDAPGQQFKNYLLSPDQLRQGNATAAADTAGSLVEQMPDSAWAHNFRGTVAKATRDVAGARASFRPALELEPENAESLLGFARLALIDGDEAGVKTYLGRVLAKDPQNPTALVSLAQPRAVQGRFDESAALLARTAGVSAAHSDEGDLLAAQGKFETRHCLLAVVRAAAERRCGHQALGAATRAQERNLRRSCSIGAGRTPTTPARISAGVDRAVERRSRRRA